MKCPVCPDTTLAMCNREGIEIDYCPTCRGVWLDRGELDKIIDRSASEATGARGESYQRSGPRYDEERRYRDRDDVRRRKRRGFLGDLFEFD